MGFLRKVGRKIKKGVKKLFSSKIGAFLGSIALSMIMGPVISRAFNGIKGALTGTGATAGQAVSTAQAGVTSAEAGVAAAEAAKQATVSLATDAGAKLTTDQILAGETLQSVASKEVAGKALTKEGIKTAFTNSTAASRKAMQSAIQAGNTVDFTNVLTQGTASGTIPLNISDTVTGSLNNINNYIETGDMFTEKVRGIEAFTQDAIANINLTSAKKQLTEAQATLKTAETTPLFGDKKLRADIKENFTGVKEFAKDPFGKTKEYVGEDFIPDVARSLGQQYVMGALQGEPVDEGGYGRIPSVGSFEPAQSSYMATVQSQIPNLPANINFQDMSNRYLSFGTLSPQFIRDTQAYLAATVPGR